MTTANQNRFSRPSPLLIRLFNFHFRILKNGPFLANQRKPADDFFQPLGCQDVFKSVPADRLQTLALDCGMSPLLASFSSDLFTYRRLHLIYLHNSSNVGKNRIMHCETKASVNVSAKVKITYFHKSPCIT